MATWATLTSNVLRSLDEPTAVFHTEVRSYLEEAELLLVMARVMGEKTATFPLDGRPIYPIHETIPDCLTILRVSYGGKVLVADHLATIDLVDPKWQQQIGDPESFFVVGGTHLGIYPIVEAGTVTLTYLAAPNTTGASPSVQLQFHTVLEDYSRAVSLAKEAQYQRAVDLLKKVTEIAGIRESRMLATDRQTVGEPAITEVKVQPED